MFDACEYIRAREEAKGEDGLPVYRATGIARLEELVKSVRETRFPCIVVDCGVDGILNLSDNPSNRSYHTVHILDTTEANPDRIFPILSAAFARGRALMREMVADRRDFIRIDPASVRYSAIGPVGMQAYGYTFNFEVIDERAL